MIDVIDNYTEILPFLPGYLKVSNGKYWGVIIINGDEVIPLDAEYETIDLCSNGLCKVSKKGKFGFVNLQNDMVIPIEFDSCSDFILEKVIVVKNNKMGVRDIYNQEIMPCTFNKIEILADGDIICKKQTLWGMFIKPYSKV